MNKEANSKSYTEIFSGREWKFTKNINAAPVKPQSSALWTTMQMTGKHLRENVTGGIERNHVPENSEAHVGDSPAPREPRGAWNGALPCRGRRSARAEGRSWARDSRPCTASQPRLAPSCTTCPGTTWGWTLKPWRTPQGHRAGPSSSRASLPSSLNTADQCPPPPLRPTLRLARFAPLGAAAGLCSSPGVPFARWGIPCSTGGIWMLHANDVKLHKGISGIVVRIPPKKMVTRLWRFRGGL